MRRCKNRRRIQEKSALEEVETPVENVENEVENRLENWLVEKKSKARTT